MEDHIHQIHNYMFFYVFFNAYTPPLNSAFLLSEELGWIDTIKFKHTIIIFQRLVESGQLMVQVPIAHEFKVLYDEDLDHKLLNSIFDAWSNCAHISTTVVLEPPTYHFQQLLQWLLYGYHFCSVE